LRRCDAAGRRCATAFSFGHFDLCLKGINFFFQGGYLEIVLMNWNITFIILGKRLSNNIDMSQTRASLFFQILQQNIKLGIYFCRVCIEYLIKIRYRYLLRRVVGRTSTTVAVPDFTP